MNTRIGLVVAGIATAALMVGGTAYGAAASSQSIPDSAGLIHGCYAANGAGAMNGTPLNIIDGARASCSKGQTPITWNQTGPQGAPGQQGVPGAGYVFRYTNNAGGTDGPQLTTSGIYFINVQISVQVQESYASIGTCTVSALQPPFAPATFDGAFALAPFERANYSFAGVLNIGGGSSSSPATLTVTCEDANTQTAITPILEQWFVSPVLVD